MIKKINKDKRNINNDKNSLKSLEILGVVSSEFDKKKQGKSCT